MKFDDLVESILKEDHLEENWKGALAAGALAASNPADLP
jgi:hypothetical protein